MTAPTTPSPVVPFGIEIPNGWSGIEHPREGVVLEVEVDEPAGYGSRLLFEIEQLPQPLGEAGPMEVLIASRASGLAELMTDGLIMDLAVHGERPDDDSLQAYRATVVFRHGPHLVTAFLWAIPHDGAALVITGLTDADLIAIDAGAFGFMVDSLRLGDRVRTVEPADVPPPLPAPVAPRERPELPAGPPGWADGLPTDERVLRLLVSTDPAPVPASIFSMAAPAFPGDAEERHAAVLADLASTMTDADVQRAGIVALAIGDAWRSLVVFRQAEESFTADVWTAIDDPDLPVVWTLCAIDDADRRAQAAEWIAQATLEELGAA